MEVFQYVLLGIAAAILALFVKSQRPEIALTLSLSAGIMLFLLCLGKLAELTGFAAQLAEKYGLNADYLGIAVKITGIACIADLGVQLCKDAGESAVASKVELGGKVTVLLLALPIVEELISLIAQMLRFNT